MSEIKEQDRKKDQEGQAAIKRLSKPIKVRILLAQIFTILSALLSFVPYLALVWLGDIFLSAQTTGEQISAVQVHKVVNLLVMAFLSKLFFHALSLIITHFADMKLRFIIRQRIVERLSHVPLAWFSQTDSGKIRNAVQDDTKTVHTVVAHAPVDMLNGVLAPLVLLTLRFTTLLNDIVSSLFGMEDRRQMLNALDEVVDTAEMPSVTKTKGNPKNSDVSLNQVTFAYVKDKPVIRNISFTVPANKMFAIVGPSGCGKTTIIKLIARFYDVNGGNICIGDIDLRDFTTEDLFKQVSFVFQDVYLFNDSLKNNILMAKPDTSERELNEIADLAGVTEMIQRLPDGWNTLCGEGGRALSGGERQRVSIARALLKHAPIVLFDEATSALDAENETNIVRSIETLRKRSTLIVVAHKLETIQMADEIIVLNKEGHIAEVGSHEKLLAKNGAYKEFWDKRNASSQWKLA